MTGAEVVAGLGTLAGLLPELISAEKELQALFEAKKAGVASDVLVAAINKLQDEASANKMATEFPQG